MDREEKSLRHVAMVAKFLDDNKPIKSLKSLFPLFQTQFHVFWQILAKFSLGRIYRYLSLEKERENFCVVFTYSIKWARESKKFYVVVVQRRQRNIQNSVMHVQSCCLLM